MRDRHAFGVDYAQQRLPLSLPCSDIRQGEKNTGSRFSFSGKGVIDSQRITYGKRDGTRANLLCRVLMNEECHASHTNKAPVAAEPVTAETLLHNIPIVVPEFIRLPPPGSRCPWTGLSRSTINELILATEANGFKPPVQSHVLRKRGAKTGVRLVVFSSLLHFIRGLPAGTEAPELLREATERLATA